MFAKWALIYDLVLCRGLRWLWKRLLSFPLPPWSRYFRSSDVKVNWDYLASSDRMLTHNWLKWKENLLAYRIGKSRIWNGFGQACTPEIKWNNLDLISLPDVAFSFLIIVFIVILSFFMPRGPPGITCLYLHSSSPVVNFGILISWFWLRLIFNLETGLVAREIYTYDRSQRQGQGYMACLRQERSLSSKE